MRLFRNADLSVRTSLGVGGRADVLCSVRSSDVPATLPAVKVPDTPLFVLGQGTNVVISDDGLRGVTLSLTRGDAPRIIRSDRHRVLISFDAGMRWDDCVAFVVTRGLQGIECLSGVPGTVGAAPVQNIGCYGQQLSDVIHAVDVFDMTTMRARTLRSDACGFGYRSSFINPAGVPPSFVVLRVTLSLLRDAPACRRYADVIGATHPDATVADVRRAVLRIRRAKAMLAGMVASAGSFFKTPTVSGADFGRVRDVLAEGAYNANWFWPQPDGRVKVAAGRIVERFFTRGMRAGPVGLSHRHALALVSYRGARAADIVALARRIQETVAERTGIILEPEVRFLGFDTYPLVR